MITFNQLKYNTFCYTMGQVPCIKLILFLLFLCLSSMLYYFSIQMHENTIFRISGRVDFLDMPILDKIENKTKEWWAKDVAVVKAANDTVEYIMHAHFLQQQPVKIEGYADFLTVRKGFYYDLNTQTLFKEANSSFMFVNYKKFTTGVLIKPYEFLRKQQRDESRRKREVFVVYDDQVLNQDKSQQRDSFLYKQNPFNGILEIEQLVYGEAVTAFRILAKKTKGKSKMI